MSETTLREQSVHLAHAELAAPTWALTAQYLSAFRPVAATDGAPRIARVDGESEAGAWHVYVPVADEPFHLVLSSRSSAHGVLALDGVWLAPAVRVLLSLRSLTLPVAAITAQIGLAPTQSLARDQRVLRGGTRRSAAHVWRWEAMPGVPATFEEKAAALVKAIEPVAARVAASAPEMEAELNVVYTGWGGDPQFGGLHLEPSLARLEAVMNLASGWRVARPYVGAVAGAGVQPEAVSQ